MRNETIGGNWKHEAEAVKKKIPIESFGTIFGMIPVPFANICLYEGR